jgi:NADPH:quinone reductase-like Zn-dependent oxidoreductase
MGSEGRRSIAPGACSKPGGRLVTIVDYRHPEAFFIVEPNQKQLIEVAQLLDAGKLRTYVGAVVPLADASIAYDGAVPNKRENGKVVIVIS